MPDQKVLLIGWDAADWKMITPLIEQGKMPNLKRLIESGTSGNLSTLQPILSPTLWTSIATGKRPYKHGIHGFSEPDPVTGAIRPVTNLSRKTKAIWNILNQEEKNTITVGWWPSNPAEELSKGVMVSNDYQRATGKSHADWPMKKGTVHPERLTAILKELRFHPTELEESDVVPFIPNVQGMSEEELQKVMDDPRLISLQKIIADCTSIHSAATALMQNEPWDLMCVYYDAIDHFGHAFMKYHPPQREKISDWDFKVYNYCVEAGYLYHDMMLGTLMRLAGDEVNILLISDHGFHPDDLRPSMIPREPAGPAIEHRQFGIFAAMGPDIKKGHTINGASLLDICPTLLHSFGLPVGEDMDGKVLEDIFAKDAEIQTIPSWDNVAGDHGMHSGEKQISPEESKAALQQLVDLGYIDEPSEQLSTAIEETVRELDYNLAQAYIDGGIFTEAAAILERLYEKWPMEHRFGFQLTTCYKNLKRYAELRTLVQIIIERRMQEAESAIKELQDLQLDKEEFAKAEEEKVAAMSDKEREKWTKERRNLIGMSRPNIYSLRYLEAYVEFAEGHFEKALEKLTELDNDAGARRNALCLRGDILCRLRQWDDAQNAYLSALSHDKEYPPALQGLARVCIAKKQYAQAVEYAEASTKLLFFQPRAHYLTGIAYYRMGHISEAENAFITCLKQAPLFAAAYKKLADIARHHRRDPHAFTQLRTRMLKARQQMRDIRSGKTQSSNTEENVTDLPMMLDQGIDTELDSDKVITVVSGLPRSGTSLMMQMLEAAEFDIFTDGKRTADTSNQKGYYEHEQVKSLLQTEDKNWLTDAKGKVVKVVAPLLSSLPLELKKSGDTLQYRVIFMHRNMEEVLHSQQTMLGDEARSHSKNPSKAYVQQVNHAMEWCKRNNIPTISVDYNALVQGAKEDVSKLTQLCQISDPLVEKINEVIDPKLYRSVYRNRSH